MLCDNGRNKDLEIIVLVQVVVFVHISPLRKAKKEFLYFYLQKKR
jgi:hypothetical protein